MQERGKYNDGTGATSCKDCERGKYNDGTGATSCKDCERGKYCDRTGATLCEDCESGKYYNGTGASSASTCMNCAIGKYYDGTGASSASMCKDCESGKYCGGASSIICVDWDLDAILQMKEKCRQQHAFHVSRASTALHLVQLLHRPARLVRRVNTQYRLARNLTTHASSAGKVLSL